MSNKLTYTSFDFDSLKNDLLTQMANGGVFKDYNFAGSNINQLAELFAGIGDLLNFYLNMTANESFLRTADLYENINKIVELVGYNPGGPKASTVTVQICAAFTSPQDDYYFTIPVSNTLTATTTTNDGQSIKYSPTNSLTFVSVSGSNLFSTDINLVQGTYETPVSYVGTGKDFQVYEIEEPQAIEEDIILRVNSSLWTWVPNLYSTTDKNVFTTRYNKNKRVEIQFGNTTFGGVPPLNSNIEVQYIKTLDIDGAIGPNELTAFDNPVYLTDTNGTELLNTPITFTIIQTDSSTGHALPLTEEEVRNYAPKYYRTQNRIVTKQDHEDLLVSVLNAFISQVVTLNQNEYYQINPSAMVPATSGFNYNNIYMYVLPKYGYTVNNNLKSRILDYIEPYKMLTLNYVINDLEYIFLNILINYKRLKLSTKTTTEIENEINTLIRNYFSKSNQRVGDRIKYSDLLVELNGIDGISSLTLALSASISGSYLYEDIDLNYVQFTRVNSICANWIGDV